MNEPEFPSINLDKPDYEIYDDLDNFHKWAVNNHFIYRNAKNLVKQKGLTGIELSIIIYELIKENNRLLNELKNCSSNNTIIYIAASDIKEGQVAKVVDEPIIEQSSVPKILDPITFEEVVKKENLEVIETKHESKFSYFIDGKKYEHNDIFIWDSVLRDKLPDDKKDHIIYQRSFDKQPDQAIGHNMIVKLDTNYEFYTVPVVTKAELSFGEVNPLIHNPNYSDCPTIPQ